MHLNLVTYAVILPWLLFQLYPNWFKISPDHSVSKKQVCLLVKTSQQPESYRKNKKHRGGKCIDIVLASDINSSCKAPGV